MSAVRTARHRPCLHCGRLLVPVNGRPPWHRKPPVVRNYPGGSTPLTGLDAPWCKGGGA